MDNNRCGTCLWQYICTPDGDCAHYTPIEEQERPTPEERRAELAEYQLLWQQYTEENS